MAVKLADAVARLGVDDKELQGGLDSAEGRMSKWGGVMTGVMMGVGLAVAQGVGNALRGAVSQIGKSITLASDLSETVSKTGALFGDSTTALLEWSETASTAFGQTQQQALDAAANFAMFGKAAGLSGNDLVSFSKDFTVLASDLASFNNTSPQQAIDAIGAALRGESEPLRQYNVLLDDATLKARAFEMGLTSSNTEALTQQQKILAAQQEIFEQTKVQQGDYIETADGLANASKALGAQWTDLQTSLGAVFAPFVAQMAVGLRELGEKYMPQLKAFLEGPMANAFAGWGASLATMGDKLLTWFATNGMPFLDGLRGIATDGEGYANELGLSFRDNFGDITDAIGEALGSLNDFGRYFESPAASNPFSWLESLGDAFATIFTIVGQVATQINLLNEAFFQMTGGNFAGAREIMGEFMGNSDTMMQQMKDQLRDLFNNAAPAQGYTYPYAAPAGGGGNQTFLPVINIYTSADPNAVAQAAQSGVQQALRGAGN